MIDHSGFADSTGEAVPSDPYADLKARLRTMRDHRGDGIPTQAINPDGWEAARAIEALQRQQGGE